MITQNILVDHQTSSKKYFYYYLFFLTVFFSCHQQEEPKGDDRKPNIVFLFTDDQTYTAVSALGNPVISTPNIDALFKNGTTFTHAYNMGAWNGAVCAASRAMLSSGRSLWHANDFRQNWIKGDSVALLQTWGKLMEQQGYDTYMTGKWHVDAPADKVFQYTTNVRPGMPKDQWDHYEMVRIFKEEVDGSKVSYEDVMPIGYNRPKDENDDSWSPTDSTYGGYWQGGKHWSEVLKDDAIQYIKEAKNRDHPFFMYLAFNAPHDPRQAPQKYLDQYPLEKIPLPKSWQAIYPDQAKIGNGPELRDEALAPFPRTEYATRKHIQEYYALISHLDDQTGAILKALKASGKMENTIIFFTADHGLAMGRHGLLGKQNLYDHSIRVPMAIMGQNIPVGKKIEKDIYLQDIMATSLEIAGIEKPDYLEFHSFLDLVKGKTDKGNYDAIYGAYVDFQRMIRKDNYKLIVYPKLEKVLLFDLKNDPEEITNLANDEAYQATVKSLFEELLLLQKQLDDPLDLNPIFQKIKFS